MSFFGSIFGSKRQHELELARVKSREQIRLARQDTKIYAYQNGMNPSNGAASIMSASSWLEKPFTAGVGAISGPAGLSSLLGGKSINDSSSINQNPINIQNPLVQIGIIALLAVALKKLLNF